MKMNENTIPKADIRLEKLRHETASEFRIVKPLGEFDRILEKSCLPNASDHYPGNNRTRTTNPKNQGNFPQKSSADFQSSGHTISTGPSICGKKEKPGKPPRLGPWIDEKICTACGDCMRINARLFFFNERGKAAITDPALGSFSDLVRAAELCPSRAIHPGAPLNKTEKKLEIWMERARVFDQ
jgi:ferredoxin